jgi:hypothetical protein
VTTPPVYLRHSSYRVTIRTASKTVVQTLKTGGGRRLTIAVPLGPSDTVQEYTYAQPPASSPGTTVYTTHVAITKLASARRSRGRHR